MKKAVIDGRMCDVVTMNEYTENQELYNPRFTAIQTNGKVLPIKSRNESGPGIYYQKEGAVCKVTKPEDNDKSYDQSIVIDYSDCNSIRDVINKDNLVRNIENEILTNKDNIFVLNINADDSPEMKAIKQAINLKQVDIKQYESRFGQFQNDIRLIKNKNKISLDKMRDTCNSFDIEAELILRDKPGCVNPMNSEIRIKITDEGE